MHWLHLALNGFFFFSLPSPSSYLMASGVLEQITKKCLQVRDPIENNQNLLLPLLSMVGFLTKITEISPVETRDSFMSIVKSTEIFGTITMMYHSMSLGECLSFSFSFFPSPSWLFGLLLLAPQKTSRGP
jgi:hypothetical protein